MKKILILFSLILLFITGCGTKMGTPTAKVEEFLGKYQSMDTAVLAQLDSVIANDSGMSDDQKKEYRGLMEKQYQNLSYKIKSEEIDGNNATVDVEIEVYDYATSITESRKYYSEHRDEFLDDDNTNNTKDIETYNDSVENNDIVGGAVEEAGDAIGDAISGVGDAIEEMFDETSKFIDYKIKQMKDVTNKTKYDITFYLTKDNNDEWILEDISDVDREKLHGLYEG